MITRIKNAVLVTDELIKDKYLYIEDDKILSITDESLPHDCEIDAEGKYVSSGFIDMHVHGGGGKRFEEDTDGIVEEIALLHARCGTTTIFPTASASTFDTLSAFIDNVRKAKSRNCAGKPHIAGAHLEGPYFSFGQRGAQNPDHLQIPKKEDYVPLLEGNADIVRRVSFAPELEGALELCEYLAEKGILAAFGHTEAIYEELAPAIDRGCTLATHLYSGMNGVTRRSAYRKLGAVETAYLDDRVDVELIADGCHLPKELLQLAYKIKGKDKICLITDGTRYAGLKGDELKIAENDEKVIVRDGVAFMRDFSNFSGSIATTDRIVRTMYKTAGIPLCDVIKMATSTPASVMGLEGRGRLEAGYYADLVFFDDDINVERVFIEGKELEK